MSKNIVELERPQMTIWRRVACWISTVTHAPERARSPATPYTHACMHAELCNTVCLSTATVVLKTRLSVTLYIHCLSCIMLIASDEGFRLCSSKLPSFLHLPVTSCLLGSRVLSIPFSNTLHPCQSLSVRHN